MNPNNPSDLDPKLKEAYERIMGTSPASTQQPKPDVEPPVETPQTPLESALQPGAQTLPQETPIEQPAEIPAQQEPQPLPPQAPQMETQTVEEQVPIQNFTPAPDISNEIPQSPLSKAGGDFVNPDLKTEEVINGDSPVKPVKKENKLMPILIGFFGILFFVIYAVIWAKVFALF